MRLDESVPDSYRASIDIRERRLLMAEGAILYKEYELRKLLKEARMHLDKATEHLESWKKACLPGEI